MMTNLEITTFEAVRSNMNCLDGIKKSLRAIAKLKALELRAARPDLDMMIDAIEDEMEK